MIKLRHGLIALVLLSLAPLDGQESAPAFDEADGNIEKPQVFEGRAGTFEFVAADQGSLQIARKVGREVLEVCDELLTPPLERIPIIAVKLVPDGWGTLDGRPYNLYQDVAGDYGLAVAWNQSLSAALFIEVLTESYLRQLVYTLSDRSRAEEVPAWLIAGASLRTQVTIRPALIEFLKELAQESEMVSLEDLLNRKSLREISPTERVASFWFLELVTRQLGNEKKIRNYFDSLIAGKDPIETLENQSEAIRTFPNGIEGWWVIGFQDIIHRENGIVLSISRSAKQLFILDRFELIDEGRPLFISAAGLWDLRDDSVVRNAVSGRLRDIETLLPRVNPVFYNAFRALGLIFQAVIEKDEDAFTASVDEFNEEVRIARTLSEDVEALSANPNAELEE